MSSRARHAAAWLLGLGLVLAPAAAVRSAGPLPPVTGSQLQGPTHLHLVVSGVPPYVYDVDAGTTRELPVAVGSVMFVAPSRRSALAIVERRSAQTWEAIRIGLDGSQRPLAEGRGVVPAYDSAAVRVLNRVRDGTCRVRLVPSSRPPVRVPCGFLQQDTAAGLLLSTARGEMLVDSVTGRVRARSTADIGGLGRDLILESAVDAVAGYRGLRLVDLATGARRPVRWPSRLTWLDGVLPEPHGTLVAIGFADPAYPGPAQASDVWILDTATGRLSHVPGFPGQVRLKFSSMAWTTDGRLVMLLATGERTVLAVWKPGSPRLPLREVHLPEPAGGSDTFVPLVDRPPGP